MKSYELLLCIILLALILMFVYFAFELNELKNDVNHMFMNSASDYALRCAREDMDDQFKRLMTEIACLATKNNADIQRVREGYNPGDVIEYDGDRYMVLKINHVSAAGLDRTIDVYRLYNVSDGEVSGADRDDVDKNSKFLRNVNLNLE